LKNDLYPNDPAVELEREKLREQRRKHDKEIQDFKSQFKSRIHAKKAKDLDYKVYNKVYRLASKKEIAIHQLVKLREEKQKKKGILSKLNVDIIPMSYSQIGNSVEEIQNH
jgi:hypothetical protein